MVEEGECDEMLEEEGCGDEVSRQEEAYYEAGRVSHPFRTSAGGQPDGTYLERMTGG